MSRRRSRYQVAHPVANPFTCKCTLPDCEHSAGQCGGDALARRRDSTGEWADLCARCGVVHATVRQETAP